MRGVGERGQRDPGAGHANNSLSARTWNLHTVLRAGETLHTRPLELERPCTHSRPRADKFSILEEVSGSCVCAHADINTSVKLNLVMQESGSNELVDERKELRGLGFFIVLGFFSYYFF